MDEHLTTLLAGAPPLVATLVTIYLITKELRRGVDAVFRFIREILADWASGDLHLPIRVELTHRSERVKPRKPRIVQDEDDGSQDSSDTPRPPRRR